MNSTYRFLEYLVENDHAANLLLAKNKLTEESLITLLKSEVGFYHSEIKEIREDIKNFVEDHA